MGNGWVRTHRARWIGVGLLGLLGLLPVACDRPPTVTPNGLPNGDTPNSMALEAEPQDSGTSVAPPPPPAGAFLAQLSPDQVAQLNSLGIDVVVPGTVPPAFQVADLRISQGEGGSSYLIVYQNAQNQCFAVEYADGGTSPPPATEHRLPIKPPLFTEDNGGQNYGLNYGKFAAPDWQAKFPGPNLYTDWLAGPSGFYRLTGAADIQALVPGFEACQDIDPETAVDLAESFTLITAPTGDMF